MHLALVSLAAFLVLVSLARGLNLASAMIQLSWIPEGCTAIALRIGVCRPGICSAEGLIWPGTVCPAHN